MSLPTRNDFKEELEYFNHIESFNEGFDMALDSIKMYVKGEEFEKEFLEYIQFSKKVYKYKANLTGDK